MDDIRDQWLAVAIAVATAAAATNKRASKQLT